MNSEIRKLMNGRLRRQRLAQKPRILDDCKNTWELRNKVNKALKRADANYGKKSLII